MLVLLVLLITRFMRLAFWDRNFFCWYKHLLTFRCFRNSALLSPWNGQLQHLWISIIFAAFRMRVTDGFKNPSWMRNSFSAEKSSLTAASNGALGSESSPTWGRASNNPLKSTILTVSFESADRMVGSKVNAGEVKCEVFRWKIQSQDYDWHAFDSRGMPVVQSCLSLWPLVSSLLTEFDVNETSCFINFILSRWKESCFVSFVEVPHFWCVGQMVFSKVQPPVVFVTELFIIKRTEE